VASLVRYKLSQKSQKAANNDDEDPNQSFCRAILVSVSRSFAAVIQALPAALVWDVCLFYLVLRALDTIEDDMEHISAAQKKQLLSNFVGTALTDPQWRVEGIGAGDERRLLEEFPKVHAVWAHQLSPESRAVIRDITQRMADGMNEFVGADLLQGTRDVQQYNLYCHYVAGLVGEGLSRLFAATGHEDASLAQELELSNSMGLFLQKTNIIRDFLEDYVDQRAFWPQSVWKKYGDALGDLTLAANRENAVHCLNELCTDALEHAPDCLTYLSRLRDPQVFHFCAIPQVMAVATLDKLYGNADVFTGVVKIRRGLSCRLMQQCGNVAALHAIFHQFAANILKRVQVTDPNYERTVAACRTVLDLTQDAAASRRSTVPTTTAIAVTAAAAAAAVALNPKAAATTRGNQQSVITIAAAAVLAASSWIVYSNVARGKRANKTDAA